MPKICLIASVELGLRMSAGRVGSVTLRVGSRLSRTILADGVSTSRGFRMISCVGYMTISPRLKSLHTSSSGGIIIEFPFSIAARSLLVDGAHEVGICAPTTVMFCPLALVSLTVLFFSSCW